MRDIKKTIGNKTGEVQQMQKGDKVAYSIDKAFFFRAKRKPEMKAVMRALTAETCNEKELIL